MSLLGGRLFSVESQSSLINMDDKTIQAAWNKGTPTSNNNPDQWRKDEYGAWMFRPDYGNRRSIYGWEIDHIAPVAHGGMDGLPNLRPLHWKNNASKLDGRLTCPVTADGPTNKGV